MLTGGRKKSEIETWKHGWKFNYLIGQLNYVANASGQIIEAYVENKYYFDQLQKQKKSSVRLVNKKIDITLISKLLEKSAVTIYLDNYFLQKILYAPHFVIAIGQDKNIIEIIDPFDGKIKKISVTTINNGISGLRNHLKYSPVLITS
jgi:uncharacterized protein YvpB